MTTRWDDALAIQRGACNPKAIARTLVRMMDDPDLTSTDAIRKDPACRLVVHQLAYLFDIDTVNSALQEYVRLEDECVKKAKEAT